MSQYDNFEICDHPFDQFIKPNCKLLIIGTFPTHQRNYRDTFPYYYAGNGNVFWPVIEKVYHHDFKHSTGADAILERQVFMEKKGIGLTDMLQKAYRKDGKSQDDYIFPITFRNIFEAMRKFDSIETIVFTSRTKIIGALGLFETYLLQNNYDPPELNEYDKVKEGHLIFEGREIELLVPYSTSRTVIEKKRATFNELIDMYERCLT
ncbi:MAG: hypothetical protein KF763_13040 [Cyclobacteriaceae bacterium]|nr:hypothetical protein [Cyclobacteriaceae bacterium]